MKLKGITDVSINDKSPIPNIPLEIKFYNNKTMSIYFTDKKLNDHFKNQIFYGAVKSVNNQSNISDNKLNPDKNQTKGDIVKSVNNQSNISDNKLNPDKNQTKKRYS